MSPKDVKQWFASYYHQAPLEVAMPYGYALEASLPKKQWVASTNSYCWDIHRKHGAFHSCFLRSKKPRWSWNCLQRYWRSSCRLIWFHRVVHSALSSVLMLAKVIVNGQYILLHAACGTHVTGNSLLWSHSPMDAGHVHRRLPRMFRHLSNSMGGCAPYSSTKGMFTSSINITTSEVRQHSKTNQP